MPNTDPSRKPNETENEGEGSYTGTRRYDAGAEHAAQNPKHVQEAAEQARKALEGSEGDALRKAEEQGKRGEHK